MQKHIRKLQRLGAYSYAVVIPKEIIDRFGWRERQKLLLSFDGKKPELTLKDWPSKKQRKKKSR